MALARRARAILFYFWIPKAHLGATFGSPKARIPDSEAPKSRDVLPKRADAHSGQMIVLGQALQYVTRPVPKSRRRAPER